MGSFLHTQFCLKYVRFIHKYSVDKMNNNRVRYTKEDVILSDSVDDLFKIMSDTSLQCLIIELSYCLSV